MAKPIAQRIYDFYGRCYGGFELLYRPRITRAIDEMPLWPGDRVLDVGIGTGTSLAAYPDGVSVVGVDLSPGMLEAAARRLQAGMVRAKARAATQLVQADAANLPFPAESFDAIFMSHVISTVPDPHRVFAEVVRVGRINARITIVNHFQSPVPPVAWVETAIDPLCRRLGWRQDLSLRGLLAPAGVTRLERPRGVMFQTVHLQKTTMGLRMLRREEVEASTDLRLAWQAE